MLHHADGYGNVLKGIIQNEKICGLPDDGMPEEAIRQSGKEIKTWLVEYDKNKNEFK